MNDNRVKKTNGGDPLIRRTRQVSGASEKISWFLAMLGIINLLVGLVASLVGDARSEKLRKEQKNNREGGYHVR